jgi:hypothetical protein
MQKRHTKLIYCGKRYGRLTAPGGLGPSSRTRWAFDCSSHFTCRGTWARVTIDRLRHLSPSTFKHTCAAPREPQSSLDTVGPAKIDARHPAQPLQTSRTPNADESRVMGGRGHARR